MQQYQLFGKTGYWDLEIASQNLPYHYRRKSWQRQAQSIPRWLKLTIIAVVSLCACAGLLRGFGDLHDQAVKQYPTNFDDLRREHDSIRSPVSPIRRSDGKHIDGRYSYVRQLAKGQEGSAALYLDAEDGSTVVVKTFNTIARNRLPLALQSDFIEYTTRWPAEIEASLLLGSHDNTTTTTGYVPVVDYFILQTPTGWFWALVTPFISHGTLINLSHKTPTGHLNPDTLDETYRPSLTALLANLQTLHKGGYCHDDVKPDNIFLQSPSTWLLGDLGNIRHTSHPWHSTRSWTRQNQWADCQLNDIRRAYKSYIWFLRSASASPSSSTAFDHDFWAGEKEWSRLYWDFLAESQGLGGASEAMRKAIISAEGRSDFDEVVSGRIAEETERELFCTSVPRRLWWWWEWLIFR